MFRTDLVDIVNSKRLWVFVGSGLSTNAGLPSWGKLTSLTLDYAKSIGADLSVSRLKEYEEYCNKSDFPKAMAIIESETGREKLHSFILRTFAQYSTPGSLHKILAEWPIEGFVTTNYDDLIGESLLLSNEHDWLKVGNSAAEIRKLSANPTKVIWHIHGSCVLPPEKSKLVLTEADYDDLYLEDTDFTKQLKSLLVQRRFLFIGFGFQDFELLRILKILQRVGNPARPFMAFFPQISDEKKKDLFKKYNVDVIPYRMSDCDHKQLVDLAEMYSSLVLRRQLTFGAPQRECPSYDANTTSLMIFNNFAIGNPIGFSDDIFGVIIKSIILAKIGDRTNVTIQEMIDSLVGIASVIRGKFGNYDDLRLKITQVIESLSRDGLITKKEDELSLANDGNSLLCESRMKVEMLSDRVKESIRNRLKDKIVDKDAIERVLNAAFTFLCDSMKNRSIGILLSYQGSSSVQKSYHLTALMQDLPSFHKQLQSDEEAIALNRIILDLFSNPNQSEKEFIGVSSQAQFGVHLVGFDEDTLRIRQKEISSTLFVLDSSTLIPFLAVDCYGYDFANHLVSALKKASAVVVTTSLLAEEVAEHARYAYGKVDQITGQANLNTLASATGKYGVRSNAFIEGFLENIRLSKVTTFFDYVSRILFSHSLKKVQDIEHLLTKTTIQVKNLEAYSGYSERQLSYRDQHKENIKQYRIDTGSYKHDRQVLAEAEALIIVDNIRNCNFSLDGRSLTNAYFVSNTRIIDQLSKSGRNVTMRADSVIHWLNTIQPFSTQELTFLSDCLSWELASHNLTIVNHSKISAVFGPLIDASKQNLQEEIVRHREFIAEMYGENPSQAFADVPDVDLPIVLESYNAHLAEHLEKQLATEKALRMETQNKLRMDEKAYKQLSELKTMKSNRKLLARAKARKQKNKMKKRKKK